MTPRQWKSTSKHHQAYIDKLNGVLEKYPDLAEKPLEDLLRGFNALKFPTPTKLLLKTTGRARQPFFVLEVNGSTNKIDEKLVTDIKETFGSMDEFKNSSPMPRPKFSAAAGLAGSGR